MPKRYSVTAALSAFAEPEFALAAAVLAQMIQDMRGVKGSRDEQSDARTFLYSAWCQALCDGLGINHYRLCHMTRRLLAARQGQA